MPPSDGIAIWRRPPRAGAPGAPDWYALIATPRAGALRAPGQIWAAAMLATVVIALNLYAPGDPRFGIRLYASLIFATLGLVAWLWRIGVDRRIPILPFFCLMYVYYYALPVFLLRRYAVDIFQPPIAPPYILEAVKFAWLGMVCMLAGYYGPLHTLIAPAIPRLNLRWTDRGAVQVAAVGFAMVGLAVTIAPAAGLPEALEQIRLYGADLCMVGIFTMFALQLTGQLDRWAIVLLWGIVIPVRTLFSLAIAAGGGALIVGLTLAIAYASVARRIPWLIIAAGTAVFFIVRPIEGPFRAVTWYGRMRDTSETEKLGFFATLVWRAAAEGAVPASVLIEVGSVRLALFPTFAEVIRDTPSQVPYWRGESYLPLLFKPIPRLLWPGKPQEVSGQSFGHRYGLIDVENQTTSINLPQTVEMYANFGLPGVLIGMAMFGLLLRVLAEMFVHREMGLGALVALIFIMMRILDIGSAASMVLGSLPWDLVFLGAIHLAVRSIEIDAVRFRAERAAV